MLIPWYIWIDDSAEGVITMDERWFRGIGSGIIPLRKSRLSLEPPDRTAAEATARFFVVYVRTARTVTHRCHSGFRVIQPNEQQDAEQSHNSSSIPCEYTRCIRKCDGRWVNCKQCCSQTEANDRKVHRQFLYARWSVRVYVSCWGQQVGTGSLLWIVLWVAKQSHLQLDAI